jgi:polysaccharide export outer membrane protein
MLLGSLFAGAASALPLSPGDRVKIAIPEGEEFSGIFEVNIDGRLEIPFLDPIPVAGLEPAEAQRALRRALIEGGLFQPSYVQVALNVVQWAPVEVFVSGETFVPGRVLVNELTPSETTQPPVQVTGQYPVNRFLSSSLKQAGGITPRADVTAIRLTRGGRTTVHDLTGILTGEPFTDVPLIAGDKVEVPSTGRVDPDLVRVSQITPSGVKIFLSNLTVPSSSNASSGISRDATSFSYGSRFSHAVVAANCAGGTRLTNAGRSAVLVRVDQRTGSTSHLERKVDSLLMGSNDDRNNPYLMANDAVACYDSPATSVRDVLRAIGEVLTPVGLIFNVID